MENTPRGLGNLLGISIWIKVRYVLEAARAQSNLVIAVEVSEPPDWIR